MQIEIKMQNVEEIKAKLGSLGQNAPKVISRVINRVIVNVKKNMAVSAKKRYIVKTEDIKKTLTSSNATSSNLSAFVRSSGTLIPLYKFKVSPNQPRPKNPPKNFKARVLKASSLKPLQGFVAKMKSGHLGVFERKDSSRLPIKELYGPPIPQMLGNEEVWKDIEKEANQTVEKRMDHEIKRLLEG